jgi:effector-binding domain-containing protein
MDWRFTVSQIFTALQKWVTVHRNLKTMNIEIVTERFQLDIYGFGGIAINKDYVGAAFKFSGKMWETVKANGLKNKGLNVWVYEPRDMVFAGVELDNPTDGQNSSLEEKKIRLEKYAYYKHIGPYNLIKQKGQKMINELTSKGFEVILPYIEIYGHWTKDETKLETELLMCLK